MRTLAVIVLALSLAGCASLKNPFTSSDLGAVKATYGAVLSAANGYKRACIAKLIPRSCRDIVMRLQPVEQRAYTAIKDADRFIRENPTVSATEVIQIARYAVEAFRSLKETYGVK